jgi:hypothetical protein
LLLTSLSLYIFTSWKSIVHHCLCRDRIYFDKVLDFYLEFDDSSQLSTTIYDKRDDFSFKIINFPNMCSNIPVSPAYGISFCKFLDVDHNLYIDTNILTFRLTWYTPW